MKREVMEVDVLIVGAGPAGLSAAIKLAQMSQQANQELQICVIEKGSEVGAHILSGAVFEPRALNELFPEWQSMGAPLTTPVTEDHIYLCKNERSAARIPNRLVPKTMMNHGNYIVSMGNLCRWLAVQAEQLGVEIFPGFPAEQVIIEDGVVKGVITGDMGRDCEGNEKDGFMPGMELRAKYTLFSEGCRGHLGKELIAQFELAKQADPQKYAIGFKEIWEIPAALHQPGLVVHAAGWPLTEASGGSFLYHAENNQIFVGLIVDLSYDNPYLSPFDEFQRMKHHPIFADILSQGKRVCYGARAIAKGGYNSVPKMTMPGAILLGCNAGTLNFSKIKGNHTAMKSGMLAAEAVFESLAKNEVGEDLESFKRLFEASWLFDELYRARNFGPALHKLGSVLGGGFNTVEQNWFNGKLPFTLHVKKTDHTQLKIKAQAKKLSYPKPDNVLSFDKLSSVFLSNTNHEENQPCHLKLADSAIPITVNHTLFDEPAQRYCPAGVYEIVEQEGETRLHINSQNCLHCKSCDIKDPSQNITWRAPEGGGGPNYPNM